MRERERAHLQARCRKPRYQGLSGGGGGSLVSGRAGDSRMVRAWLRHNDDAAADDADAVGDALTAPVESEDIAMSGA